VLSPASRGCGLKQSAVQLWLTPQHSHPLHAGVD